MTDETNAQADVPAEAATPAPETEQANVDSAPTPDAPENASEPETEDKPKGGFQKRIAELTRNWREEQRRNDELLAILRSNQAPAPRPEVPDVPPTLESVGFDETKYQQALIAHAERRAEAAADAKIRAWQQQQQVQAQVESFKSRESTFAESVEDYADVVYDPSTPISAPMAEVIRESEVGPQLAYYLGKNRNEAAKIAAMSPIAAARELGRLEAKLAAPVTKPVVPKAPPPPPKVDTAQDVVEDDPEKMPIDKWIKWREKQLRKKG